MIPGFEEHVKANGGTLLCPLRERGPMIITALKDPDGNIVEFTQLGDRWMKHLEKRRAEGHCMIDTWKKQQTK